MPATNSGAGISLKPQQCGSKVAPFSQHHQVNHTAMRAAGKAMKSVVTPIEGEAGPVVCVTPTQAPAHETSSTAGSHFAILRRNIFDRASRFNLTRPFGKSHVTCFGWRILCLSFHNGLTKTMQRLHPLRAKGGKQSRLKTWFA
jgi:hypothetical protein